MDIGSDVRIGGPLAAHTHCRAKHSTGRRKGSGPIGKERAKRPLVGHVGDGLPRNQQDLRCLWTLGGQSTDQCAARHNRTFRVGDPNTPC